MNNVELIKLVTGEVILARKTKETNTHISIIAAYEIRENLNPFANYAKSVVYWIPVPFDFEYEIPKEKIVIHTDASEIKSLALAYKSCLERAKKIQDDYNTVDMYRSIEPETGKQILSEEEKKLLEEENIQYEESNVTPFPGSKKSKGKATEVYSNPNLSETDAEQIKEILESFNHPEDDKKN